MRIVFDGQALLPPRFGIGHYTDQLVRALAREDAANRYVVLYPRPIRAVRAPAPPAFPEPGVELVRQRWWPTLVDRARRRLGVGVALEDRIGPFDVFHAPNYLFAYPIRDARKVVTVHDATLLVRPEWHPRERRRRMTRQLRAALDLADRIVADSEATKRDLVTYLSVAPDRVTVVPLAAEVSFRPMPEAAVAPALRNFGLRYGGYLLFVGTIEPRKNLVRLLEAHDLAGPGTGPLVVAGAPGWNSAGLLDRLRRAAPEARVRYLGYVPDAARAALMNGARAFVYPSLYEGFGLPPLEAMACGTPVLASTTSALPETVGEAGLLVDPADIEALAAGMRRLWEDAGLREDLRARGLVQARRFSWGATARRMLAIYRDLAR